jgi:hypothetical protein
MSIKHTRFGYMLSGGWMSVFKRREFAKWQANEKLADSALCKAVEEMESGLIDADLGGCLYKKRIPRDGAGKSGGYRTLLSARVGARYVFLFGFAKSARANISAQEKKALRYASSVFLGLSPQALASALQVGTLEEVHCDQ